MKAFNLKRHPVLLAAALVASASVHPQALAPNSGVYVGISAGQAKAKIDSTSIAQGLLGQGLSVNSMGQDQRETGYKAFVGVPLNPNWAVEAGYFDLGQYGFVATTTPPGSLGGTARIKGLNLDLVATLPITERWSLMGRVGAAYAQTRDQFTGTGAVLASQPFASKNQTNYKWGFGTQYALTPALSVRLDAERYRVNDAVGHRGDVDMVSVGLVYRFGGPPPRPIEEAPHLAQAPVMAPVLVPPPTPTPVQPPAPQVIVPIVLLQAPEPEAKPAPKPWAQVKLGADSLFGFDQDHLQADGKQALDKLLMDLKGVQVDKVVVTGHTDRLGRAAYNAKLSERRAQAVRNYLVQMGGLSAGLVSAVGVGASQPETQPGQCKGTKATQDLITCLRIDRRVDVQVSGSEPQR